MILNERLFENTSSNEDKELSVEDMFKYLKEYPQQEENSLSFTFDSLYPFSESQVSFGGINPSEIDFSNMRLIRYPDIQVLGEMIDLSFPCGGYHIGSAFLEGYLSGGIYD